MLRQTAPSGPISSTTDAVHRSESGSQWSCWGYPCDQPRSRSNTSGQRIKDSDGGSLLTLTKICRISDYETARALVWQGADLLGFHFIEPGSLSADNPLTAINRKLSDRDNFRGGVLLSRTAEFDYMRETVVAGDFRYVQVHCKYSEIEIRTLVEAAHALDVQVISVIDPRKSTTTFINAVNQISDYILIDSIEGGTGRAIDDYYLESIPMDTCFLAGGLTADNVEAKIARYKPRGVDVQSSIESTNKKKDLSRTRAFIASVTKHPVKYPRQTRSTCVALSLTRQESVDLPVRSKLFDMADILHLDLVDKFEHPSLPSARLSDLPAKTHSAASLSHPIYDLHVFGSDPTRINTMMEDVLNQVSEVRVCYLDVQQLTASTPRNFAAIMTIVSEFGIRRGVAVRYVDTTAAEDSRYLDLIERFDVADIQLVGASSRDRTKESCIDDINAAVEKYSKARPDVELGIDRGLTSEVLMHLNLGRVGTVNFGKAIWDSRDPLESMKILRQIVEES